MMADCMAVHEDYEQEWFRGIYNDAYQPLLAYARRRVDAAIADEVVADTFLTAWRRRADIPDGAERLWLFGVARNMIRNAKRASARSRATEARLQLAQPPQGQDPAESAAGERAKLLRAALGRLSEADREVLMLVAWEELSHAEAAQALGISVNAVAIRVHRARKRLAARLGQLERAAAGTSKVKALPRAGQVQNNAEADAAWELTEGHRSAPPEDVSQGNAGTARKAP